MYALDLNVKPDAIGLLKMDFLGLRNLTILQNAVKLIQSLHGLRVDLSELPLDDKLVLRCFAGWATGVFRWSPRYASPGQTTPPDVFGDIVALVALYRPGPMALIPDFVKASWSQRASLISIPISRLFYLRPTVLLSTKSKC